jgi:hypothetical protein
LADISIGSIVAQLKIDTSGLTQGLQQAQQSLQAFQHRVQSTIAPSTQAAQSQAQLTHSLHQLTAATQQATQAQSAWTQALAVATGVGLATSVTGLVRSLATLITHSVTLAAKMQDLHLSFRAIDGSGAAANATLGRLWETAPRLGGRWQSLMRAIVSPPLRPWLAPNPQRQYADATTASGRSILHFRTLGESMDPLDDRLTILERAQLLHDATLRRHGDMLARHGGVSRPLGIYHLC